MNVLLLLLAILCSAFANQTLTKYEFCFLSQDAFQDSRATIDVLLRHRSQLDPQKAVWRDNKSGYKVMPDSELRMCFSYHAYPTDQPRLEKEVVKFKLKYRESEINFSDRLRKQSVPLKLSETGTSAAFKRASELNRHISLVFDPIANKEIKLRYAKHHHQTEGIVYGLERLKKNRFLSDDVLSIRAFYVHERLIEIEFQLNGKQLKVMRGSRGGIDLKEVMEWFSHDPLNPVYSFYPVENFDSRRNDMYFSAVLETL